MLGFRMRFDVHIHLHDESADECAVLSAIADLKETIMSTLTDYAAAVNSVGDQLQKALAEIQAELASMGNSTPAMDDALARLQAAAQALDDLNVDTPPAPPPAP